MLTPSTSLILKHVVGSASGAQRNDWQSRSSSSTRGCVRSLALRGRAAWAVCARVRHPCSPSQYAHPEDVLPEHTYWIACQVGAPRGARKQPFPSMQALLSTARGCGTALRTPKGKVYALGYFAKSHSSSLWSRQHTLDDGWPAVIEGAFWPPKFVIEVFLR